MADSTTVKKPSPLSKEEKEIQKVVSTMQKSVLATANGFKKETKGKLDVSVEVKGDAKKTTFIVTHKPVPAKKPEVKKTPVKKAAAPAKK